MLPLDIPRREGTFIVQGPRLRPKLSGGPVAFQYGYFADPPTGKPLDFQAVSVEHLRGRPLPGLLGWIFFWVRIPQYCLLRKVLYVAYDGVEILVHEGFVFNGGSVPFVFWWLYPPDQSDCFAAFLVHDFLCTPPFPRPSVNAHRVLRDCCRANGASPLKAGCVWLPVRVFGPRFRWDNT